MGETKLKPGNIDQAYNEGDNFPAGYTGSMAKAMEDAFLKIWPKIMDTELPEINNHLRMMFISIAQGVVQHLADNAGAFTVVQDDNGDLNHNHNMTVTIKTEEEL